MILRSCHSQPLPSRILVTARKSEKGYPMNIGQAAKVSRVSAKMIRHYEGIGLIGRAPRTEAGYRVYGPNDIHILRFIRRARDLGFSIERIARLIRLWQDRARASADVKAVALDHVRELRAKIATMEAMARTLEHLAANCHGDDRPDCPILDDLARPGTPIDSRMAAAGQRQDRVAVEAP